MLKNIDPLLTPELLHVLALMGHGDEIAIVDANFPADSVARGTRHGKPVVLAGASATQAVAAVLSVLPLDEYVGTPVRAMAAPATPEGQPPQVHLEVQEVVGSAAGHPCPLDMLERFDFYEASRSSYAVVLTGERRLYGNFLIKKGVVPGA
ncbi:MAG: RbsD/FucU family protein [Acidimicrobiales bacterium]